MKQACLFFSLLCFCTLANAEDFPHIKEGLWKSTIQDRGQTKTSKQCFGSHESVKEMFEKSKKQINGVCQNISIESTGKNSFTSKVNCDLGITKMEATSIASGDFEKEYTVRTVTKMNPPIMGQAGGTTESRSVYLGPCGDLKPGEVQTADGQKFNMNEMAMKSQRAAPDMQNMQKMMQNMPKNFDMKQLQQMQKQMQQMMQNK